MTSNKPNPFFHANKLLPATMHAAYTHSLVVRSSHTGRARLHRLYAFTSYDAALAAYEAVVAYQERVGEDENQMRMTYAVRSLSDPNVSEGMVSDEGLQVYAPTQVVGSAVRP